MTTNTIPDEFHHDLSERVALGVALLDERRPGWRTLVNPTTLHMQFSDICILGQLTGQFFGVASRELVPADECVPCGFLLRNDEYDEYGGAGYRALTKLWRDALTPATEVA